MEEEALITHAKLAEMEITETSQESYEDMD